MAGALTEVFARFRAEVDDREIRKSEKSSSKLIGTLGKLATVVGGGALLRGFGDFALTLVETTDEIGKASARLGILPSTLQELRFAAERSGVGSEKLGMALGLLTQKTLDATRGSAEAQKNFKDLGVVLTDSTGALKPVDQLLSDLATGFQRTGNPTERTALAMKLFGEAGKDLVPLLEQGGAGVDALRKQFQELGGGFSDDVVAQGEEAADALTNLRTALTGLKGNVALTVLPVVSKLSKYVDKGVRWFKKLTKNVDLTRVGLVALGVIAVPTLIAGLSLLFSPAGAIIAGAVLLGLLVEDLITAFKGGKSAVGDFFQEFLGVDVVDVINSIIFAFYDLKTVIQTVWEIGKLAFAGLLLAISPVGLAIAAIVRTVKLATGALGKLAGAVGLGSVAKSLASAEKSIGKIDKVTSAIPRASLAVAKSGVRGLQRTGSRFDANRLSAETIVAAGADSRRQASAARATVAPTNNVSVTVNQTGGNAQQTAREVQRAIESAIRRGVAP